MFVVRRVVEDPPHPAIDVAVAIVTRRSGEKDYLARTLKAVNAQRKFLRLHVMLWWNGPAGESQPVDWAHAAGHNMGQHIGMNVMLDRACEVRARYFLRVDDDCWPESPKDWMRRLVTIADRHQKAFDTPCILAPKVRGLRNPPPFIAEVRMGRTKLHLMEMLGGICRLHPMSLIHDFRWNVRLPMGFGEAEQIANFAKERNVPLLRDPNTVVSHGGSTETQEQRNPIWKAEHDRLQMMPYGL